MPRPAHFQLLPILMLLCRTMSGTTAPVVAMPAPLHSLLTGFPSVQMSSRSMIHLNATPALFRVAANTNARCTIVPHVRHDCAWRSNACHTAWAAHTSLLLRRD